MGGLKAWARDIFGALVVAIWCATLIMAGL
jgi:hypothetical protein